MSWAFGDVVVYRDLTHGRISWEMPARVVEDTDERVVLWWPVGAVGRQIDTDDRLEFLRLKYSGDPLVLRPQTWHSTDILAIVPAGATYALWRFRDENRKHIGWYCNIQAPYVRAPEGIETCDWTLDVWAGDDLSYWLYKDEAEVAWALEQGIFDDAYVAEIRAAGRAAVELIERRDPVFDGWGDWEPPTDWTAPTLP